MQTGIIIENKFLFQIYNPDDRNLVVFVRLFVLFFYSTDNEIHAEFIQTKQRTTTAFAYLRCRDSAPPIKIVLTVHGSENSGKE